MRLTRNQLFELARTLDEQGMTMEADRITKSMIRSAQMMPGATTFDTSQGSLLDEYYRKMMAYNSTMSPAIASELQGMLQSMTPEQKQQISNFSGTGLQEKYMQNIGAGTAPQSIPGVISPLPGTQTYGGLAPAPTQQTPSYYKTGPGLPPTKEPSVYQQGPGYQPTQNTQTPVAYHQGPGYPPTQNTQTPVAYHQGPGLPPTQTPSSMTQTQQSQMMSQKARSNSSKMTREANDFFYGGGVMQNDEGGYSAPMGSMVSPYQQGPSPFSTTIQNQVTSKVFNPSTNKWEDRTYNMYDTASAADLGGYFSSVEAYNNAAWRGDAEAANRAYLEAQRMWNSMTPEQQGQITDYTNQGFQNQTDQYGNLLRPKDTQQASQPQTQQYPQYQTQQAQPQSYQYGTRGQTYQQMMQTPQTAPNQNPTESQSTYSNNRENIYQNMPK